MIRKNKTIKVGTELNHRIKLILIFLLPIYIICSILYFLPSEKQKLFILVPSDPNIFSMYFSHFLHTDSSHLLSNLLVYTLVIILLILLIEKDLRIFYKISLLIFFMLPFILSLVSIIYFNFIGRPFYNIIGLSGIVSAYLGYFLVSFSKYLLSNYGYSRNVEKLNLITFSMFLLLINVIVWIVFFTPFYMSTDYLVLMFSLSLFSFLLLYFFIGKELVNIIKNLYFSFFSHLDKQKNLRHLIIYLFGVFNLFIILLLVVFSFPSLITFAHNDKGFTNILSHYVGYVFGFLISFLTINSISLSINNENKHGDTI